MDGTSDTATAADSRGLREVPPPDWQPLVVFCLYRLVLAALLVGVAVADRGPALFGRAYPALFLSTSLIYAAVAVAFGFLAMARREGFYHQVVLQLALDIVVITLLMYASGGVPSGLGMLLVVVVAAGGILTLGRTASALAAAATLALFLEQSYAFLSREPGVISYTQAGLLGATLFATALLAQVLAAKIRQSEALAARRGVDLANLNQLNEYVIQRLQAGILVIDDKGTLRLSNQSARDLLGLQPAQRGQHLARIAPPLAAQLSRWRSVSPAYTPEAFYLSFSHAKVLPKFIALGRGSGTLVFLEDASLLAGQAQQLKLASLGRLAASIAHEIRNPLSAISHAGQLLRESARLGSEERRLLEIVFHHCGRMNEIIENVLQLSRRNRNRRELLDLKPWLERFLEEFCRGRAIDRDRIPLSFDAGGVRIYADPLQLHQILWNLCDNAWRYARDSERFPSLQLRVGYRDNTAPLWVEVMDTGPGIAKEIVDKVFEPFFTTRGSGTGLGLYMARELAECNEARLEYRPAPWGGSCFRIGFYSLAAETNTA